MMSDFGSDYMKSRVRADFSVYFSDQYIPYILAYSPINKFINS